MEKKVKEQLYLLAFLSADCTEEGYIKNGFDPCMKVWIKDRVVDDCKDHTPLGVRPLWCVQCRLMGLDVKEAHLKA